MLEILSKLLYVMIPGHENECIVVLACSSLDLLGHRFEDIVYHGRKLGSRFAPFRGVKESHSSTCKSLLGIHLHDFANITNEQFFAYDVENINLFAHDFGFSQRVDDEDL